MSGAKLVDLHLRRRFPDVERAMQRNGSRIAIIPPGRPEMRFDLDRAGVHVNLNATRHAWSLDAEDRIEAEITANSIAVVPSAMA